MTSIEPTEEGEEGEEVSSFLREPGNRSLLSRRRHHHKEKTCNKYPRICWKRGSLRRACCRKMSVNVFTDGRNCGWCGHKCRFSDICCNGKCVDPKAVFGLVK
uniref:Stigma-specific Stig1 family protein n=1 Tax=Kalanchoe fedtschenkoi TaxID=63787 RepID=A0A7N0UE93_KALFE